MVWASRLKRSITSTLAMPLSKVRANQLDRRVAGQQSMPRAPDLTHAAFAQAFYELVTAELGHFARSLVGLGSRLGDRAPSAHDVARENQAATNAASSAPAAINKLCKRCFFSACSVDRSEANAAYAPAGSARVSDGCDGRQHALVPASKRTKPSVSSAPAAGKCWKNADNNGSPMSR